MAEAVLVLILGLLSAGSSLLMEPFGPSPARKAHTQTCSAVHALLKLNYTNYTEADVIGACIQTIVFFYVWGK